VPVLLLKRRSQRRIRRVVKVRGYFPNEQAALKCVYMAITRPST
jgi:transposase-like protein